MACAGLGLVAPIALAYLGAAQAHLALLSRGQRCAVVVHDGQLYVCEGSARGADLFQFAPCFHHGVAGAGLGQPIGVDIASAREQRGKLADAFFGCALTAAHQPLKAGQVVLISGRGGEAAIEHDRGHPCAGDLLAGNERQGTVGIELALHHQCTARDPQGHTRQVECTDVIERTDHQQLVLSGQTQRGDVVHAFPRHVAVAVHHSFGSIGGAAGVHQPVDIIHLAWIRGCAGGWHCRWRQQATVCLRITANPQRGHIVGHGAAQFFVGQQQADFCVRSDVRHFVLAQPVVHREKDRAHLADGQGELQKRGTVFHQQRDHIARLDAARLQHACGALHSALQLRIRHALRAIDQRQTLRLRAGPPGHACTYRHHDRPP